MAFLDLQSIFIYLKFKVAERERCQDRGLRSTGSLPGGCNGRGWGREPASFVWVSYKTAEAQPLGPFSAAFPMPRAGSWVGNGSARTRTAVYMRTLALWAVALSTVQHWSLNKELRENILSLNSFLGVGHLPTVF